MKSPVHDYVMFLFREFYGDEADGELETDADILAIDPNNWDMDPSPFYSTLETTFGSPIRARSSRDMAARSRKRSRSSPRWNGGKLPAMKKGHVEWSD